MHGLYVRTYVRSHRWDEQVRPTFQQGPWLFFKAKIPVSIDRTRENYMAGLDGLKYQLVVFSSKNTNFLFASLSCKLAYS